MLKAERQLYISNILENEKKIIASDLSIRLNVSEDTIRRDLNEMNDKGLLKRVHSGAIRFGPPVVSFEEREVVHLEEKIKLAKEAAKLIKNNDVILIDGGTTNYQLVKQIPDSKNCTIITNSIPIMNLLKHYPNTTVIGLGGTLFKESLVLVGTETIRQLNSMHPDIYFMGVANINEEIGVTTTNLEESYTKQKMMQVSNKTACLVTTEKIETISKFVVCKRNEITYFFSS